MRVVEKKLNVDYNAVFIAVKLCRESPYLLKWSESIILYAKSGNRSEAASDLFFKCGAPLDFVVKVLLSDKSPASVLVGLRFLENTFSFQLWDLKFEL